MSGTRIMGPATATRTLAPPAGSGQRADGSADADSMAALDPPAAPGPNGWTPSTIRAVRSDNPDGFVPSAWRALTDPVAERPGQRLSTTMIDELAPYFAEAYGVPEQLVRDHLARVYVYVGGPSSGQHMAMTFDRHVFVPSEESLQRILSPSGKRWLAHELAHTMQFLVYSRQNRFRAIGAYVKGLAIGHNPSEPATGGGPSTWGAIFTGLQLNAEPRRDSSQRVDRPDSVVRLSTLPAGIVGGGAGLGLALGIDGLRRVHAMPGGIARVPHPLNSLALGATTIAGPMLLGAAVGQVEDLSPTIGRAVAIGGGAASGAAGVLLSQRLLRRGAPPSGRLGLAAAIAGASIAAGGAAALAHGVTVNSLGGWSNGLRRTGELREDGTHRVPEGLQDAVHDAHWLESDAEAVALGYVTGTSPRTNPVTADDARSRAGLEPTIGDRIDWSLTIPAIVGVPAGLALAPAVLGGRLVTGSVTALRSGTPLRGVAKASWQTLASLRRGPLNALATAGSVTLVPLVVGGAAANAADAVLGQHHDPSGNLSRAAGVAAATGATALMLRFTNGSAPGLLKGALARRAGLVLGAAAGLAASSAAVQAARPQSRSYRLPDA